MTAAKLPKSFHPLFSAKWLAVFFLACELIAAGAVAQDKLPKLPKPPIPTQDESTQVAQDISGEISRKFPGSLKNLQVSWDEQRKLPSQLRGLSVAASSLEPSAAKVTRENAAQLVRRFVESLTTELKVDPAQLKEDKVWAHVLKASGEGSEAIVHFSQQYKALPVIGTSLNVSFRNERLVSYWTNYLPIDGLDVEPVLSIEDAFKIAGRLESSKSYLRLPLHPTAEEQAAFDRIIAPGLEQIVLSDARLVVYPYQSASGPKPELAWEIRLSADQNILAVNYYIGAKDGLFLQRRNGIDRDGLSGTISGPVYKVNPQAASVSEPIGGLRVSVNQPPDLFEDLSDENGFFSLDGIDSAEAFVFSVDFGGADYINSYQLMQNSLTDPAINWMPPGIQLGSGNNVDLTSQGSTLMQQASNIQYFINEGRKYFGRGNGSPFDMFYYGPIQPIAALIDHNDSNYFCNSGNITSGKPSFFNSPADYGGYLLFNGRMFDSSAPTTLECEPAGLSAEVVFHEFTHYAHSQAVSNYDVFDSSAEGLAIKEAFADYFAMSFSHSELQSSETFIGNGYWVGPIMTPDVRDLNPPNDEIEYNERTFIGHHDSQILSGAFWDMRLRFQGKYGTQPGVERADELVVRVMKEHPYPHFIAVLDETLCKNDGQTCDLSDGSPDLNEICDAFYMQHGILDSMHYCISRPSAAPTPITPPTGSPGGLPRINNISVPVPNTSVDKVFSDIIGSASAPIPGSYTLALRPYGGVGPWTESSIVLPSGGSTTILNDLLGQLNTNALTDGCYYDLKLSSSTSDGSPPLNHQLVFKHRAAFSDEMPRMVCVYRTAHEGGENDACQMLAIVSDPKPDYYQMAAADWRRGRPHLINARPNEQYRASVKLEDGPFGPALCDPGGFDDCLHDCWNIIGTNSNNSGGNDGLNNVFCAANSGCSPVSFSGCENTNSTCITNAFAALEAVYHKVLYFHYTNWEWIGVPGFGHARIFKKCDDDNGTQTYSLYGGNQVPSLARRALAAVGRSSYPVTGDLFDRFDELYSSAQGPAVVDILRATPTVIPRVGFAATVNCQSCGCPSTHPYCNSSSGVCEQKCQLGQNGVPFGQCAMSADQIYFCDNGTLVPGCNRPECLGLNCGVYRPYCNASSGNCVQCLSASHCSDTNSCTVDSCSTSNWCSHYVPNDCGALGTGGCGISPSGCNNCGCKCHQKCSLISGQGYRCVYNPRCDKKKCKTCDMYSVPAV